MEWTAETLAPRWARETVKDDIAKESGHAESEVTGAGWNLDSQNSNSKVN